MLPLPIEGRVYTATRQVRLGDAAPDRRARLDALARYLQDVAEDDAAEAELPSSIGWVLRRTRMTVVRFPLLGERLHLATFCSGIAARWAERTTTIRGDGVDGGGGGGGLAQATSVWVAIDLRSGTPARLGERFTETYGVAAGSRSASARLALGPPPDTARESARPWPLRTSDLDVWGHVNNAVAWAAVEDAMGAGGEPSLVAEVEHHRAIEPHRRPLLAVQARDDGRAAWLLDDERGEVLVAALVTPLGPADLPGQDGAAPSGGIAGPSAREP